MKTRSKNLFVLVLLLILGFIFLLPHGGYRHAVEAYKKELLARGEKLTIAELAPPPSTNASNGAKAFMQLMGNYKLPTNLPTAMRIVAPGLAEVACTNLNPDEMVGYELNLSNVAKLRDILNGASVLDFNVDYSMGFHTRLPHLIKLKYAAELFAATAVQALHEKNYTESRLDLLAATRLVRLFGKEPIMISDLVRAAMARLAIDATWEGLQCGEWTDPQLADMQAQWQNRDLFNNSDTAISFERASGLDVFNEARETTNGLVIENMPNGPFGTPRGDGAFAGLLIKLNELYNHYPRYWIWKSSGSYDEELFFLQVTDAALTSSRVASANDAFAPAFEKFKEQETNIMELHPDATNHFLLLDGRDGSIEKYQTRFADTETARRLTVTAIALKRYHLQHGAYPVTLNDLVPIFLSSVPADFMDGKPLRYKLRSDGDFLLYSVGEDGNDDGGDPTPVPPSTSFNWLSGRDIVWPRVATPAALEEYRQNSRANTNTVRSSR